MTRIVNNGEKKIAIVRVGKHGYPILVNLKERDNVNVRPRAAMRRLTPTEIAEEKKFLDEMETR